MLLRILILGGYGTFGGRFLYPPADRPDPDQLASGRLRALAAEKWKEMYMSMDSSNSNSEDELSTPTHGPKWEVIVIAAYASAIGGAITFAILGTTENVVLFATAAALSAALSWIVLQGWRAPILLRRAIKIGAGAALVFPPLAALVGLLHLVAASLVELPWTTRLDSPRDVIGMGVVASLGAYFALFAGVIGSGLYWLARRSVHWAARRF